MKDLLLNMCICGLLVLQFSCTSTAMYDGFVTPPDSTKPGIYWYWLNENVSKEGITKDLEALYKKGFGEVYIGNIYWGGGNGTVQTLSDEWLECMRYAIKEGS